MQPNSKRSSKNAGSSKGGFRLKALPEDAYKGQQQKLKQSLIQKAKLKKNYAKVLRQEFEDDKIENGNKPKASIDLDNEESVQMTEDAHRRKSPPSEDFTKFGSESDGNEFEQVDLSKQGRNVAKDKSYRQRMKARKQDSSAINAAAIKQARAVEHATLDAKRLKIQERRQLRTDVKKRETSRTKKGQPLMKDRIKNILDKLQAA